ncbi:MAG TPA: methyltransferase regulatory domain-containing protein, partial [Chthoniobacteraceae bacterium]|nr:methyltransferase regulatory domain-containing protein [Chthoniobacteraceae bacterium]
EEIFAPKIVNALHDLSSDRIEREQYLDFLKLRRFRQTLLCHGDVRLAQPCAEAVGKLLISSAASAGSMTPPLEEGVMVEFRAQGDASVTIADSLSKAALVHLASIWPNAIAFDALWEAAHARLQAAAVAPASDASRRTFAETLLRMYSAPIVGFHAHAPRFLGKAGERPVASAIARRAIASAESNVTNLWHRTIRCDDPLAMQLIVLMDGTRNRAALIDELTTFCETHAVAAEGHRPVPRKELRAMIASGLEENLGKLARMAVLVA